MSSVVINHNEKIPMTLCRRNDKRTRDIYMNQIKSIVTCSII